MIGKDSERLRIRDKVQNSFCWQMFFYAPPIPYLAELFIEPIKIEFVYPATVSNERIKISQ